ncbi:MAG TPA: hypothetical protein VF189_06145 [Patescibacteria group bacterium]
MTKPDCLAFKNDPNGFPTDAQGNPAASGEVRDVPIKKGRVGFMSIMRAVFSGPTQSTRDNAPCQVDLLQPAFEHIAGSGPGVGPTQRLTRRCNRCGHEVSCQLIQIPTKRTP